jgi:choline dehydrogenase-like flavoprotein
LLPGRSVVRGEALATYVRGHVDTAFHPVGTCKMGADPMAVVDDALTVRGVSGLRVADASIMPTIVNGNTNVAAIMIVERAADIVRRRSGARGPG